MKFLKYICVAAVIASMTACSLDETYKSELDQDVVYTTASGYNGLINACYLNLYYLYGKEDGIPMMEMGDLWQNGSATSSAWKECVNNYEWNTECGVNKVVWNALYATIAYCNTAIYYQDKCTNYSSDAEADSTATEGSSATSSAAEMKAKVAEAYFMRAFSYFHVVEQWGGVTLTTTSMAEEGAREYAYRSTEEEIYDQIISDLMIARASLPVSQGEERGRATKGAANAMLAKAWLQRTRLERDFAQNPNGKQDNTQALWYSQVTNDTKVKYTSAQCADSAYKYAEEVINAYSLYPSDDQSSGSTKEWSGDNNKNNQEFIFLEAIDHENGYNPEGWNRGRTRQYYMMGIGSAAENFGISGEGIRYGRSNTTRVHPTLWLLNDCFEPSENTVDTRFNDTFYWKYYISKSSYPISYSNWIAYGKDPSAYNSRRASTYTITGNIKTGDQLKAQYPGMNYYADATTSLSAEVFEMEDNDAALGCYTPNWPLDSTWCAKQKFLCAGLPSLDGSVNTGIFAYFQENGSTAKSSYYRSLSPSLKKLSPLKYCYTNQQSLNDFPIIRLTDIYLVAAEATLISGHNPAQGLEYLKAVRRHAALAKDADKICEGVQLSIDYLAKERARELCGENWRWYDLKRMGLLNSSYLNGERKNIYGQTYQTKWYVRPVPQQLLDQIANPDEYGSNGY